MTKRSLNTFMNALTAQDYTMYPFSTQNKQDYYNLMDVYLDAIFFPRLNYTDYLQEGHRLEFKTKSPDELERTGVVYNEMKGALGSASSRFGNEVDRAVLPGTHYEHISGGDPPSIASLLTYERLVEFHKTHYHPSNAFFYSYGDLDLEPHLERVNNSVLSRFSFSESSASVWKQIANSKVDVDRQIIRPETVRVQGPLEPMLDPDEGASFCMARCVAKTAQERPDTYQGLVYNLTANLLLDGPSAPLYANLLDAQLAPAFCAATGWSVMLHPTFGVGVKGIDGSKEKIQAIREATLNALRDAAKNGFDEKRIEAVIHQIDLMLRRKPPNFGLNLMFTLSMQFTHGATANEADFLAVLNESITIKEKLERLLKESNDDPLFWQRKVEELFLHRDPASGELTFASDVVEVLMEPKEDFLAKQTEKESEGLKELASKLTQKQREEITMDSEELLRAQAVQEDASCLPSLCVKTDVPRAHTQLVNVERIDDSITWVQDQKTNGLVYFRCMFDASHVNPDILPWLNVFAGLVGNVDAGNRSYKDLALDLDLVCDGLGVSSSILPWHGSAPRPDEIIDEDLDSNPYRQVITVSTCCLPRNLDKTVDLMAQVLNDTCFQDEQRLANLLNNSFSSMSSSIVPNSLGYLQRWALAPFGEIYTKREALDGVSQVNILKQATQRWQPGELALAFGRLFETVFTPDRLSIKVVAGGNDIDKAQVVSSMRALKTKLQGSRNDSDLTGARWPLAENTVFRECFGRDPSIGTYFKLPVMAHNVVACAKTDSRYGNPDDAAMMVLSQIMSSKFLHQEIREKGGAYGAGASHMMDGKFRFMSHDDPNYVKTLKAFDTSIDWACAGSFSETDVEEALLSIFGSIDAPQDVSAKGSGLFFYGITNDDRQAMRDRLLAVEKQKCVQAAEKHLLPVKKRMSVAISGGDLSKHTFTADDKFVVKDLAAEATGVYE